MTPKFCPLPRPKRPRRADLHKIFELSARDINSRRYCTSGAKSPMRTP